MRREFKLERRAIVVSLVLLVGADVALAVYSWNLASAPRAQQDVMVLTRNRDLLRADIARAQEIRQSIPDIKQDCDRFEQSLYPAASGYSSVSAELGEIARKAGLQVEGGTFRQTDVKGRGLTEVQIDATVTGGYAAVVRFLNGLQRSSNVYAVEGLSAKSELSQQGPTGQVRVTMHIKTYFRNA
jgi:type IV pilus assembly protein PilO